jgi:hypothetical protein
MRILTIETRLMKNYGSSIELNHIKSNVLKALSIENQNNQSSRGVLVHIVEEKISIIKKINQYIITKQNTFQKLFFSLFNYLKGNSIKALSIDFINTKLLLDNSKEILSRVVLAPENNFYNGFIINFAPQISENESVIVQLQSNSDEVVITSHTNYKVKDCWIPKYSTIYELTGTLVVIHCQENTKLSFDSYTATSTTKDEFTSILSCEFTLNPVNLNTENIDYIPNFNSFNSKKIKISNNYFGYLMSEFNSSLKDIYELLNDKELNQEQLDIFTTKSRLKSFDNNFDYTQNSII